MSNKSKLIKSKIKTYLRNKVKDQQKILEEQRHGIVRSLNEQPAKGDRDNRKYDGFVRPGTGADNIAAMSDPAGKMTPEIATRLATANFIVVDDPAPPSISDTPWIFDNRGKYEGAGCADDYDGGRFGDFGDKPQVSYIWQSPYYQGSKPKVKKPNPFQSPVNENKINLTERRKKVIEELKRKIKNKKK